MTDLLPEQDVAGTMRAIIELCEKRRHSTDDWFDLVDIAALAGQAIEAYEATRTPPDDDLDAKLSAMGESPSGIADELRLKAYEDCEGLVTRAAFHVCCRAANEIERLQASDNRLVEALAASAGIIEDVALILSRVDGQEGMAKILTALAAKNRAALKDIGR